MGQCMQKYLAAPAAIVALMLLAACQPVTAPIAVVAQAAEETQAGVLPTDPVEAQIANAMSAAPMAVAKDATILGFPTEGTEMVALRKGTNDWTCFADWPASPTNDPQCNDPVWTAWTEAFFAGKEPNVTEPGIAFMLQGGDDTSNTDPFAPVPAEGQAWVTTAPHLMLLLPGGFDASKFTTDHASGLPYIMWEGTPYEHLMIPVADMAMK
jgi:hypothetical protein